MITQNKFCCICNSRDFEDYNNRKAIKCRFCDSLERHRGFALALFSLPSVASMSLCIVKANTSRPKYLQYLSGYLKIDFVSEDLFGQDGKTYDVVYHDHLLSGTFIGAENYSQLITRVAEILIPGGIQLFSASAPSLLLGSLLNGTRQIVDGFAPAAPGNRQTKGLNLMAFDPVGKYGGGIADVCVLGKSVPTDNSGDIIFAHRKPL